MLENRSRLAGKRTKFLGEIATNTQKIAQIRKNLNQLKEQTALEFRQGKVLVEKITSVDKAIARIELQKRELPVSCYVLMFYVGF